MRYSISWWWCLPNKIGMGWYLIMVSWYLRAFKWVHLDLMLIEIDYQTFPWMARFGPVEDSIHTIRTCINIIIIITRLPANQSRFVYHHLVLVLVRQACWDGKAVEFLWENITLYNYIHSVFVEACTRPTSSLAQLVCLLNFAPDGWIGGLLCTNWLICSAAPSIW